MLLQEGAEEQAEVLDEVLLVVLPVGVGQPDVGVEGQHLNGEGNRKQTVNTWLLFARRLGFPGSP